MFKNLIESLRKKTLSLSDLPETIRVPGHAGQTEIDRLPLDQVLMTDFTLHSLGVILHRLRRHAVFVTFVQDVLLDGGVALMGLPPAAMADVVSAMDQFNLDFEDRKSVV